MKWRWVVEADAADEGDAQIVSEVLEAAVRDERNDPDEAVEVQHRRIDVDELVLDPTCDVCRLPAGPDESCPCGRHEWCCRQHREEV